MTQEEKAKAYDGALEQARKELKHCGSINCDAARQIFRFFPELAESEGDRIRKRICLCLDECVHSDIIRDYERDECLAYLEKQKEQKSAGGSSEKPNSQWSEEDETAYGDLIWCIEQAKKSAKDENDMGNIWFAENWVKNHIKSLRPQPHWKPSEEQMEALKNCVNGWTDSADGALESLYNDLKKL